MLCQNRTKYVSINILTSLLGQIFGISVAFITRIVFARELGEIYLGINGLCTSIVGLLSIAELGIGVSINYKLYQPLAENNIERLKALMGLYKRVYISIGIIILGIGLILIPVLPLFLNQSDALSVNNFQFIFLLFIINSACSYFYSYKRALIISDQKQYIVTIIYYSFFCIMNIGQILVLLFTNNFILYLLIMLACTIMQNIAISKRANKLYPFITESNYKKVEKADITDIKKNTYAMLCHKIGASVVNSTDSILASRIVGIGIVGIYSNYLLITNAINSITSQLFSATIASVGNLGTSAKKEQSEAIFNRMFWGNYVFVSIICTVFYTTINLLIKEWFGPQMVLPSTTLNCIIINLYLYNIRRTVWTFRDAYGLFWFDRYKAIAEAILNLVISIILGHEFGLTGILTGTIIATIMTSLWVEPYILYKYAFKKSCRHYFVMLLKYTFITFCLCFMSGSLTQRINFHGIWGIIMSACLGIFISLVIIILLFFNTDEFKYYFSLSRHVLKRISLYIKL